MKKITLTAEGTRFSVDEYAERLQKFPRKMELINGQLYYSDDQRRAALAFLLENFGVDMAVRIGDIHVWKEAITRLENE